MHKFNAGDPFPNLGGESVNHGTVNLPGDIPEGNYGIVLAYRANW
jgi:hypothetical protein